MTETRTDKDARKSRWQTAGVVGIFVAAGVVWLLVFLTGDPDNWKPCDQAMHVRLYNPNYDVSTISWQDQGNGVQVARGTVHSGSDTFSFECGVTDGELSWLDIN